MKLFLASLASATLDLAKPLLPAHPNKLKLAFIPTAVDLYLGGDISWFTADHLKLEEMDFNITDYDIKNKNITDLRVDLEGYDVIFVAGGNSFYLLNEVKKSGFDVVLGELLNKGVIYMGSSAGSCIMCPTILHLVELDHPDAVPELADYSGINLYPKLLVPHFGREKYRLRHEKIQREFGGDVVFLHDDQAVIVNNDKSEIVKI